MYEPCQIVLIEHFFLLRPGEVGSLPGSDEKNLLNESLTWHPKFEDPLEISIQLEASKTSSWKHETLFIHARCNCDESVLIIPCPVHLLKHCINMQNACHETKFKSRVARRLNVRLDPSRYAAHTLRQGRCTDMARHDAP